MKPPNIFSTDPEMSPKLFLSMIISYKKSFQNAFRIFLELFYLKNMFMINYNLAIVTKVSTNDLFNIFFVIFLSDCQLKSRRCWKKQLLTRFSSPKDLFCLIFSFSSLKLTLLGFSNNKHERDFVLQVRCRYLENQMTMDFI